MVSASVVGVAGVAVQRGLLAAQAQDARATSRLSCSPACSPRLVQARQACLAQVAPVEKLRKGTTSERASVITGPAGRARGRLRAAARTKGGRPARSSSACSGSTPGGFVVQHVLREARGQLRQLLHHLRVALRAAGCRRARRRARSRGACAPAGAALGVQPQPVALRVQRITRANSAASW
jgi:hypothetical protein